MCYVKMLLISDNNFQFSVPFAMNSFYRVFDYFHPTNFCSICFWSMTMLLNRLNHLISIDHLSTKTYWTSDSFGGISEQSFGTTPCCYSINGIIIRCAIKMIFVAQRTYQHLSATFTNGHLSIILIFLEWS